MKTLLLPVAALIVAAGLAPLEADPAAVGVPPPAVTAPAPATAPPVAAKPAPPTPQSVERMIELTQGLRSYDALAAQVRQFESRILAQAAAQHHLTPAQRAKLVALTDKLFADNQKSYSWEKVKSTYIRVYSANFSQQDVDAINAFYESPTGRTFIAKLTASWQRSYSMFQSQIYPILQKTALQIQALAAQLAPPPPPASKPAQPPAKPVQPAQPAPSAAHSP
jgi:hypothetical protein